MIDTIISGGIIFMAAYMSFNEVISPGDAIILMVLAMILHKIKK